MAEENMADIAMARQNIEKTLRLFQPERVKQRQTELDRRMMQEDVGLPSRRIGEPRVEPGKPLVAEFASDAAFGQAVEEQQRCFRRIDDRLHEAIVVGRVFGKCRHQIGPPVVISRQQPVWQRKPAQGRFEIGVAFGRPGLGQVAAEDAKGGITMAGIDVVDAAVEPLMQVRAIADLAASSQMDIGDLDDFHATSPWEIA
jgi:hypothetical protein